MHRLGVATTSIICLASDLLFKNACILQVLAETVECSWDHVG